MLHASIDAWTVFRAAIRIPIIASIIALGAPHSAAAVKQAAGSPAQQTPPTTFLFDEAQKLAAQKTPESLQLAIAKFESLLRILHGEGDSDWRINVLFSLGQAYDEIGDKKKAVEYLEKALPIERARNSGDWEAVTLVRMGTMYLQLGEKQKALDSFLQILPFVETRTDTNTKAETLDIVGGLFRDLGDRQKALEYFEQALFQERANEDRSAEATTLATWGKSTAIQASNRMHLSITRKRSRSPGRSETAARRG